MEAIAESLVMQFGGVGILVVVLIYMIQKLFKRMEEREMEHRQDRKEMNSYMINAFDKNISLLSEIKTIIENKKK